MLNGNMHDCRSISALCVRALLGALLVRACIIIVTGDVCNSRLRIALL